MAKVMAIVDQDGRVLVAQFGDPRAENDGEATPSAQLLPMSGQRVVQLDVPDEVQRLPGPDLHRFFSQVEVSWPATVNVPRIEVIRRPHDSAETDVL
jgi:hypothetical protein